MIHKTLSLLTLFPLFIAALSPAVHAAVILDDSFTSLNTTSVWDAYSSAGALDPAASGGNLVEEVTSTAAAQRSLIVTQGTNFNPFTAELTVTVSDITLNADGLTSTGSNQMYVLIGLQESDPANPDASGTYNVGNYVFNSSYYNGTGAGAFGYALIVNSSSAILTVYDFGSSNSTTSYTLNGTPTDVTLVIDGEASAYTITISGTTFASDSGTSVSGTFSNFSLSSSSASKLVLGSSNVSTVDEATVGTWGSVTASSSIPEPATVGWVAICGLLGLVYRLRAGRKARA